MSDDTRIKPADSENDIAEQFAIERLFHEINLLRLEGYYFCFDPKEAARRNKDKYQFVENIKSQNSIAENRAIIIEPSAAYGYPSALAYKILQAIIKKVSEYRLPLPDTVHFSQRELARLIGRKSYGGWDQKQFIRAIRQLKRTSITCQFYNKTSKEWKLAEFQILDLAILSGKDNQVTQCSLKINELVIESLNSRHAICLNYSRMEQLEPISMALYKHLFFHFSNIYSSNKKNKAFTFKKDYADICTEWLGGLKILRYQSVILRDQLQKHIDALKKVKLIQKFEIEKNTKEDGFNLIFHPGNGFFDDYTRFYAKQFQLEMPARESAESKQYQEPFSLVAYFYTQLYPNIEIDDRVFSDKEIELARSLLASNSYEALKDLIAYTIEKAKAANFPIQSFGGIRNYIPPWLQERSRIEQLAEQGRRREADERSKQLQAQYEAYRNEEINKIRNAVAPEIITEIEESVRVKLREEGTPLIAMRYMVQARTDIALAERYGVLAVEDWRLKAAD